MMKKAEAFPKKIYLKPSLQEQLTQLTAVPLTVVEAPFGYGKTTAVKRALLTLPVTMVWENCEAAGADAAWRCFVRALQNLGVAAAPLNGLNLPSTALQRQYVVEVLQACRLSQPAVLVWNHYHLLQSAAWDQLLLTLTDAGLTNWHFVLLTQQAPDFTVADLVLKGACLHLPKQELAFTVDDIIVYYRKNGIILERRTAEQLLELTEGWVSALYLYLRQEQAGQSLTLGAELLDLLQAVAYGPCSGAEQTLLQELSVLQDDFTSKQACYITKNDAATALLQKLVQWNGFISYQLLSGTYHLHPALKEYLRRRSCELPEARRRALYRNCGQWQQLNGNYQLAFGHYHAAGDYDKMLTVFEQDRGCSFANSYQKQIFAYFAECPAAIRSQHIQAGLIYAIWLFVSGAGDALALELERLKNWIDAIEDDCERSQCLGELEFLLAETKYNDLAAMARHFRQARQLLHQPVRFFSPQTIWGGGANSVLFMFYRQRGSLQQMLELFPAVMADYCRLTQNHGAGAEAVLAAEAALQRGNWEQGLVGAVAARNIAQRNEQIGIEILAEFTAMRINTALGDKKQLRVSSQRLDQLVAAVSGHLYGRTIEVGRAWLDLQLGDKGKSVAAWLRKGDFQASGLLYSAWGCLYIVYGRYLLLRKDYLPLLGYLHEFDAAGQQFNNFVLSIYAAVYSAAAREGLGQTQAARSELQRALSLADADGIVMPFVENFELLQDLLEQAAASEPANGLLAKIMELGQVYQANIKKIRRQPSSGSGGQALTVRETAIAEMVTQGMTNAEIAEALFLAEITVKKALQGIYRQLGVASRLELVLVLNAEQ